MSAVLDFRDLRDKVLAGEMDEDEEEVPLKRTKSEWKDASQ